MTNAASKNTDENHHQLGEHPLLASLADAMPLRGYSPQQLVGVAAEIRDVLCNLLATRTAHFASNLGGAYNLWRVPGDAPDDSEPRQLTFYDGMLFGLPQSARMTKFAIGRGEVVLPLEQRESDIYLLEIAD